LISTQFIKKVCAWPALKYLNIFNLMPTLFYGIVGLANRSHGQNLFEEGIHYFAGEMVSWIETGIVVQI